MNAYEEKQEAKRERYEDLAAKNRAEATRRHQASHAATEGIPLGQPILVGHHSEGYHRRALAKSWNNLGKAVEATEKAAYYDQKAASVGKAGISSDDPEAVVKLREKLAKLEDAQVKFKASNKIIRKKGTTPEQKVEQLVELLGYSPTKCASLLEPDFAGRIGFAPYVLQNNNANIASTKKRITSLANRPTEDKETTVKGVRVLENVEENRIQLFFDGKPSAEIRTTLKRNGFRWAPYHGAWQRQLTSNGIYAAKIVLKTLPEEVK